MYMTICRVQSRYISEVDIKRRRSVVGVHDKDVCTLSGHARVDLWRIRSDNCRRVIRHGGLAHCRVLVECKKLPVRDDLDLLRAELRKLHMRSMIACSEVDSKVTGVPHTSVPSKMGLFMNAHTAKCVRCSWVVKLPLPLPISIISMSLCAKKSTADRCSTFFLMIDLMYSQVGLTLAQGHHGMG